MAYYYPEGYFGPICDSPVEVVPYRSRAIVVEDPKVDVLPELPADYYDAAKLVLDPFPPFILQQRCRVDENGDYYDCEWVHASDLGSPVYDDPIEQIGLKDKFFVPSISSESCSPFDADINIRPTTFVNADGTEVQKTLRERSSPATFAVTSPSGWNDEANEYTVWVNPEVCTLPNEVQNVTYLVPIPTSGTYAFTFGADDTGKVFLNDNPTPILDVVGGLFISPTPNSSPHVTTANLTAGTLKVTVEVTNGTAGNVNGNGDPTGDAFNWAVNPGGWYLKICQGTACSSGTSINWVRSGPHPAWSSFMNNYAVYPSNTDSLVDTAHSATWNIVIPAAGSYTLELQTDNNGTVSWDGTQIASSSSFTSSTTYTITNVTQGLHTLVGTITNVSSSQNEWAFNPGGIAWTLTQDSTSTIVAKSLDLSSQGNGNLVWHTRQGTEYEYIEV